MSTAQGPVNSFQHSIPLSLYVHFPWCMQKCPYCDFNSHPVGHRLEEDRYIRAVLADLDFERSEDGGDRELMSVFLGGGTPSLFSPTALAAALDGIAARFTLAQGAEITLEANPGTTEYTDLSACRNAGINRLSIGVQSFHDEQLRSLGRIHTASEAVQAFHQARKAGFRNINLDLMYGLPRQTVQDAIRDLQQALMLEPDHLSVYQLTLEPNTVFHRYPPALPAEEERFHMQEALQDRLEQAGFDQYEVSAYAKDGRRCQHNLNYWHFGDYIGVGAGAHGKQTKSRGTIQRRARKKHPAAWLAVAGTDRVLAEVHEVEGQDLLFEFFMNALRLRQGFTVSMASARTGHPTESIERMLAPLITRDLVSKDQDRMTCTPQGYLFLDEALTRILPNAQTRPSALDRA